MRRAGAGAWSEEEGGRGREGRGETVKTYMRLRSMARSGREGRGGSRAGWRVGVRGVRSEG